MFHRLALGLAVTASAALFSIYPTSASTPPPEPSDDPLAMLPTVEIAEPTPSPGEPPLGDDDSGVVKSNIPSEFLPAIQAATIDHGDKVNNVVWDASSATLTVYATRQFVEEVTRAVEASAPSAKVDVIPSVRSQAELDATVYQLIDRTGLFPDGTQVAMWYPSDDGSSVTFELAAGEASVARSALPDDIDGLPINYRFGTELDPALRVNYTVPVYNGVQMSRSGGGAACTSGFPVIQTIIGWTGNLTADHCGSGTGEKWLQGYSPHVMGYSSGQLPYGTQIGTDLEVLTSGSGASGRMAWGSAVAEWAGYPINGYFSAVVGQQVCHNGAYSGSVCFNNVTSTATAACYGGGLPCYLVVQTQNNSGVPAAGNGDSGGPVGLMQNRPSDGRTGFYGTGIISGIANPTTNCTGEPGSQNGRKCSSVVLFAPIQRFYEAQNTLQLLVAAG